MCSQSDFPPYDPPKVTAPRTYVLSGTARVGSPALAAIGDMLNDAEYAEEAGHYPLSNTVELLREVRNRVMAAER